MCGTSSRDLIIPKIICGFIDVRLGPPPARRRNWGDVLAAGHVSEKEKITEVIE